MTTRSKVAVLGAGGFVGRQIVKWYQVGYEVVAIGNDGTWKGKIARERPNILFVCSLVPKGNGETLVKDLVEEAKEIAKVCRRAGVSRIIHVNGHVGNTTKGRSVFIEAKQEVGKILHANPNNITVYFPILFGEGDRLITDAFLSGSFPDIDTFVSFMHVEDAVLLMKAWLENNGIMQRGPVPKEKRHLNIIGIESTFRGFLESAAHGEVRVPTFVSPWLVKAVAYGNSQLPSGWEIKGLYPYVLEALEQYMVEYRNHTTIGSEYSLERHEQRIQQTVRAYKARYGVRDVPSGGPLPFAPPSLVCMCVSTFVVCWVWKFLVIHQ